MALCKSGMAEKSHLVTRGGVSKERVAKRGGKGSER